MSEENREYEALLSAYVQVNGTLEGQIVMEDLTIFAKQPGLSDAVSAGRHQVLLEWLRKIQRGEVAKKNTGKRVRAKVRMQPSVDEE